MPRTATKPSTRKIPENAVVSNPSLADDPAALDGVRHKPLHDETAHVDHEENPIHAMLRAQDHYAHPTRLDAPTARPGYVQRWVRVGADSQDQNWSMKVREGWEPRKASTVPHGSFIYQPHRMGEIDVIRVGNQILCELPIDLWEKREAAMSKKTDDMQRASIGEAARMGLEGYRAGQTGKLQHGEKVDVIKGHGRPPTMLAD